MNYLVLYPQKMIVCIFSCTSKTQPISSLDDVKLVYLPFFRIKSIGAFQHCRNLTICILHSNCISFFPSLISCPLLKKLDLHSNQVGFTKKNYTTMISTLAYAGFSKKGGGGRKFENNEEQKKNFNQSVFLSQIR